MRATVVSVSRKPHGSVLVTALTAGDTVLEVESAADFPEPDEGETLDVTVAGQTLAYTGFVEPDESYGDPADPDQIVLAAGSLIDAPEGTRVDVPDTVRYEAEVLVGAATLTETATIAHGLRKARQLRRLSTLGTPVEVERDRFGELVVTGLYESDPDDDGAAISTGTLRLSDAVDIDDVEANNLLPTLARKGNYFGVTFENPVVTGHNADGDGITWDGPAAKLTLTQDGEVVSFLSALLTRLGGRVDADQFGADEAAIHLLLSLAPGALFQLRSQLKPPAPPAVVVGWPFVVLADGMPIFDQAVAPLTFHDGKFWLFGAIRKHNVDGYRLQAWTFTVDWDTLTTSGSTLEWEQPLGAATLWRGVARIGSAWYFLVRTDASSATSNAVQIRDDTGAITGQWDVPASTGVVVCLGADDSGNVLVAWDRSTSWDVNTYDVTGGAPTATVNCADGGGGIAAEVMVGGFDLPATRIVLGVVGTDGSFVYATTGGSQVLADEWDNPIWPEHSQRSEAGMAWNDDDEYWAHLSNDGKMFRVTDLERQLGYGDPVWRPAGIESVHFLVTLRDASGHETEFDSTKITTVDVRAGQQLVITAGAVPTAAGADRYALYAATAGTARTDFHLIGTPAAGDNRWTLEELVLTGANPPAVNSFPSGTSALTTADGVEQIRSDGTGHIYDLIAAGGGGGGGIGGVDGGVWGDTYGSLGVDGGGW